MRVARFPSPDLLRMRHPEIGLCKGIRDPTDLEVSFHGVPRPSDPEAIHWRLYQIVIPARMFGEEAPSLAFSKIDARREFHNSKEYETMRFVISPGNLIVGAIKLEGIAIKEYKFGDLTPALR